MSDQQEKQSSDQRNEQDIENRAYLAECFEQAKRDLSQGDVVDGDEFLDSLN